MKKFRIALGLGLVAMIVTAGAQASTRKPYIIELADSPIASYNGTVAGLPATRPAPGTRLNLGASAVQQYTAFLDMKQTQAVALVPAAPVTYRYKTLLNGFAAWLTDAEFAKLAANPAVRAITVDSPRKLDTNYTPAFLGVSAPGGVWSRVDGSGRSVKGEDVILGHVDGGVWPENPSVSDKVGADGKPVASHLPGTVVYGPLPRFTGICEEGEGFKATMCNNKLLGARYFNETFKLAMDLGIVVIDPLEYLDSPRDQDGHGTHTLTTAGGNENVDVEVSGTTIKGISGIAPRARLAAYKACWNTTDPNAGGSCYQSDSVAAIEQAVEDGVDVVNFSISGSQTSVRDAVETAFANAALSGVFVAASAGNSGPGNTVAHNSPWITTVGNSTHDRYTEAIVTLSSGSTAQGASFQTSGVATSPLIWSREAGFGAPAAQASPQALCFGAADGSAPLLDPAKVTGKILVCDRGSNALVNKVANAKAAGAIAVIIQNTSVTNNTTPLIAAVLPTVHLPVSAFAAVTTAASTGGTASIGASFQVAGVVAPVMASSSSRGPNKADPDVLKPDITAPGTDIIAAYSNTSITAEQREQIIAGTLVPGPGANMISGTSMSSPHVAGAAALLRQANPSWSPSAIKSALLTSASQNVKLAMTGAADTNRWGFGAGHLNPNGALETKLIYESTNADYINYYLGLINGRQLNLPTLTYANVVGAGILDRRLTNRGSSTETYTASATLPGFSVSVAPASLTLAPGETKAYRVILVRNTAVIGQYSFGEVAWNNGVQTVRSPLTAKAESLIALTTVTDTRNVGTKVFTVATGYDGSLKTTATGLVAAQRSPGTVATGDVRCSAFTVPAGARMLRAQLFNSETEGGSASDLDLTVYREGTAIAASAGGTSDELVTLGNPAEGNYQACVEGYAPVNGEADFTLNLWVVPATVVPATLKAAGPAMVYIGGTASVAMSWNVPAGARYLGVVDYSSPPATSVIGRTTVFIDNTATTFRAAPVSRDKTPR